MRGVLTLATSSVLIFAVLCAWACAQPEPPSGTQCPTIAGEPGCVCKHPKGTINLTALANTDGTPKFNQNIKDSAGYNYYFNPCNIFTKSGCSNVYVCQGNADETQFYDVADAEEQIWIDDKDTPYLYYTGPANRNTRVYLNCDPSVTGTPEVTTTGDTDVQLSYVFYMKGADVCPGHGGGGGGGGSGEAGNVAGIAGLVIIFLMLGALVAYFIIGAVIMKVHFKKTGSEIIPNKGFWFALPLLIKDGVLFTFSPCISAFKNKGYSRA